MKIMIAVDDTPESHNALEVGYDLFGGEASYVICTIADRPAIYPFDSPMGGFGSVDVLQSLYDAASAEATRTATSASADIPGDESIAAKVGSPGPAICELAEQHGADLIVLGSHDRSVWEKIFHPSVGRYVIEHAPCSVLVVR